MLGQQKALLKIVFELWLSFYGILITSAVTRNIIPLPSSALSAPLVICFFWRRKLQAIDK